MALDQAANFVREQVTSAISAGDTTINVADASPFPVPPEGYNIVVWDGAAYVRPDQDPDVEIMRVTDTDTTNDTLTVARGQEGTSDFNHPDTSVVVVAQTAKMIADIASEKISNPVTETVDANGNDVTNVGALDANELATELENGNDVTSNRSVDSIYQNQNDYDIIVYMRAETLSAGESGVAIANVAETQSGASDANNRIYREEADGDTEINRANISFRVPAGYHYQIETFGTTTANNWLERGLITN